MTSILIVLALLLRPSTENGQTTRYGYNELGQQITQTDARGKVTRYEADSVGRRLSGLLSNVVDGAG